MPHDDTTPPGSRHSGEWPEWAGLMLDRQDRIERKLDGLRTDFTGHVGDDKLMRAQLDDIREDKKASLAWRMALGAAVIGSPILGYFIHH